MRTLYFHILLLFFTSSIAAQQPTLKFEHIQDGLSNTSVHFITQDRQGFMWFGTNDGLNRYDGYSFKQFKNIPGDSTSIANNNITQCYQTQDGRIWVGTYDNMSFYDPLSGQFRTIRKENDFRPTGFASNENGLLWVGAASGLFRYNINSNQWKEMVLPDNPGSHITITQGEGNWLWISTWNGFYKYNTKTNESKKFYLPRSKLAPQATSIVGTSTRDKKGFLWFTSWQNGLHRFDPVTEKFESFYHDTRYPASLYSNITKGVAENTDGTIWIANNFGGLTIYDPSLHKTFNYVHQPADPFSIYGSSAESVYSDKDGTIWIGTDKGINKYSKDFNFFKTVKLISHEHPGGGFDYYSLIQDKEGDLWAGGFFGFYHISLPGGKVTEYSKKITGKENPHIYDLYIDESENKTLWAASDGCLYKIEKSGSKESIQLNSTTIPLNPYLPSIQSILKEDSEHLWLLSIGSGIYKFHKTTYKLEQFLPDAPGSKKNNEILCFWRLDTHHLLAGVRNTGVMLFDTRTGKFTPVQLNLPKTKNTSPVVLDICQDKKKNIWIATLSDGLIKTDPSFQLLIQYTELEGLPSMRVSQVEEDQQGNIWLNTFGGLSLFDPVKNTFSNYGNKEGLLNPHMLHDFYKNEQGVFFMGDEGSLQVFDPFSRSEKNAALPVYITTVKVQDQEMPLNSPLTLDYNRNYIRFDFVALDYNQSEKIKYAYLLEGSGNGWQLTGNQRSVSFSNLKEGRYTFKVKAAGSDGIWHESKDQVHFRIRTPFWKAWWFYLLALVAVTGSVYYLYLLKIRQIRNEEKIRDKIARDLHDDIGSTLSGINLYSKMALNKNTNTLAETKIILSKIEERTGNMMDAMSDIVWSINPHNDTVADLLVRMREYAAEILEAKDISYQFESGGMTGTQKIDLNTRKEIFLVFKEAVNNAAKHSNSTKMVIEVSTKENRFDLRIRDNGKGMDINRPSTGNGLFNMKTRAKQVNGNLVIESSGQEGTSIHLQVPLT